MARRGSVENKFAQGKGTVEPKQKIVKASEEATYSGKKKVFSFRGDENKIKYWRKYATLSDLTLDEIGSAAMDAYIKAHPLDGPAKELIDEYMNT